MIFLKEFIEKVDHEQGPIWRSSVKNSPFLIFLKFVSSPELKAK